MNNTTSTPSSVVYNLSVEVNRVSVYTYAITMTLAILTNTVNIGILSRKSLRSSSCSHYFLALAIDSLLYTTFSPLNQFLTNGFGISITNSPFACRITQFYIYSTSLFFTAMLVCASIDRFLTSSASAWLRNLSSVRIAQRVIIIVSILIIMFISPFIFICHWNYNTNQCLLYSSTLIDVYLSSRIVVYNVIGPLAMFIFGLLTINNVRNQTRRVTAFVPQTRRRRTEGQLTRVLIIQVGVNLIFSLPNAVTYVLTTFIPSIITPTVNGIRSISLIWQQSIHFLSLFSYILSASVFRKEFQKIFRLNGQHNGTVHAVSFVRRPGAATITNNIRVNLNTNNRMTTVVS